MATVHRALAGLFAALLDPLRTRPPLLALTLISAASGVLVLLAFRFTSNPVAIRIARQRAQAHLLAIRLYRSDLAVVARAQRSLMIALAVYMGRMLVPFVVLLLPFALLFAHIEARYGTRAFHPGERGIMKVMIAPNTTDQWRLESEAGIVIESSPVRIPEHREIAWRIRADAAGCHQLTLVNDRQQVRTTACVGIDDSGVASQQATASALSIFTAPTDVPIEPGAGIDRIEIGYPARTLQVHGWTISWLAIFLMVSAAVAWFMRKPFGVEF